MKNKLYTISEINATADEWTERLQGMRCLELQVFANRLEFALNIARQQGAHVSDDQSSLQYSPIYEIINTARELAKKKMKE